MRMHSQMRIIAGSAKGRPIACVPGDGVRPTPERMRGALLNILGPEIQGASILDLFSGTGSLGLEALSRGARHCTFVEMGFGSLQALRQNIESLGFSEQASVLARDVAHVVTHLTESDDRFDFVFAAPPYAMIENRGTAEALFDVFGQALLGFGNEGVTLSLQHSPRSHVPEQTEELERFDRREYGFAHLSRYLRRGPSEPSEFDHP